jgi:hypothetical protein
MVALLIFIVSTNKKKPKLRFKSLNIPRFLIFLLLGIAFIIVLTGLTGLIVAPNNWDSMTYHMSRIAHWIQNKNVNFYPTHILRQLHQNPWSEFAIMHFQILSGGDRFANLLQWFSMIGCILGVSLIAKLLGANTHIQIIAAALVSTIPMGILQASSTQNDYVVSYWLVCFLYFFLLFLSRKKYQLSFILGMGASLGLATLTKATTYIFTFPFLIWIGYSLQRKPRRSIWKFIFFIAIFLTINLGHYLRNFDLYGSPLGPTKEGSSNEYSYIIEVFSLPAAASNIIRNSALHCATPDMQANVMIEEGVLFLHRLLGIDINDPRTTWRETEFHVVWPRSEDYSGNLLHFILIAMSFVVLLIFPKINKSRVITGFYIALLAAFFLFCLIIKWQPWHSRLHLPLFVLFSPLVAITLSGFLKNKDINMIVVILLLYALPFLLKNSANPLIGTNNIFNTSKIDQYFVHRPNLRDPYIGAAQFLNSQECRDVGLYLDLDDWEYPLWFLLKKDKKKKVHIEHINVRNNSAVKYNKYPFNKFRPCAILSLVSDEESRIVYKKDIFVKEWKSDPVKIYMMRKNIQ